MLTVALDNIRKERAIRARELEYIKEMAFDEEVDELTQEAESMFIREPLSEYMTVKEYLDTKVTPNDSVAEEEELNRILEATEDLDFDDMIDLEGLMEKTKI